MKCQLPKRSLKRSKKGYEEIHLPAPTSKPATDGELVAITTLPSWARAAFTVPRLDRVQSNWIELKNQFFSALLQAQERCVSECISISSCHSY